MSVRQSIVDALTTALATIRKSGGFNTDAGKNVFEWRQAELAETNLPGIIVRDTTDPMVDEGVANKIDHLLSVEIEGHCRAVVGSSAAQQVRLLAADILAALGADPTLGNLGYDLRVLATDMMVKEADKRFAVVEITIQFKYRTARWAL